ncbi:ABC transporter substrate-binding protein [Blastochloris viridis]|uniref:ABC-type nitrate/sulfonate/bicarbonate transport systems n=1 Tax=Blastochloris viridis TaxID=1079 RepID=A0A0H5BG11_BLAVI|nr:ABC transporter substrate-binding protein [Blastochloris viridis]ALK10721.1 NMT1/THI5 like protein [Blastochloris viridis]BAR99311.1 ABC-type nitrate/sulfonate/bicarbonate transport systems [Blastochloris viridis]CUU43383.1 ABC-type taurine transport system, periplasmic component [Blastochloris viridis]
MTASRAFTRRAALAALGGLAAAPLAAAAAPGLSILAAPSTASILIARAVESAALATAGASFAVWRSPDQLRAALVSGEATAVSLPTNVAANLDSRGLKLKLVSVISAGHMHVLSVDPAVNRLADLKGKHVQLYFRNDMPDVSLRWLLKTAGLVPDQDVTLDYAGSATEATQLVLAGRASTVLLNEPIASAALLAAAKAGLKLRRAFTLQSAWAEQTGSAAFLPMAGLAVTASFADQAPDAVRALHRATADAVAWVKAEPAAAAALAEARMGFPAAATKLALAQGDATVIAAREARPAIEAFLSALAELSPALIGGQLPGDGFYFEG